MVLANPSGATAVPNAGNGQPGSSPAPTASPAWSATDGAALYGIDRWGDPYFCVSDRGHVMVQPRGERGGSLDLVAPLAHGEVRIAPAIDAVEGGPFGGAPSAGGIGEHHRAPGSGGLRGWNLVSGVGGAWDMALASPRRPFPLQNQAGGKSAGAPSESR
jgi:hypothetical protein